MTDKELISFLVEENKRLWATIERLLASPQTININSNNNAGNDIKIDDKKSK